MAMTIVINEHEFNLLARMNADVEKARARVVQATEILTIKETAIQDVVQTFALRGGVELGAKINGVNFKRTEQGYYLDLEIGS